MTDTALSDHVLHVFADTFGTSALRLFEAPGRVNLIGEHTDYNNGFVLPCTIPLRTLVAASPSDDGQIHVVSADYGEMDCFEIDHPIERSKPHWKNYVRGVAAELIADGVKLQGARIAIAGDIPRGSGLSSSASLEVAVGTALVSLADSEITPTRLAQVAQRAENAYAGVACGIMDQLVVAHGMAGHAMLIDCESLSLRPVPMPDDLAIIIVDSGIRHAHVDGAYAERRRQCEAAARFFGIGTLRDLDLDRLEATDGLDDLLRRRARHVLTENQRVNDLAHAISNGDMAAIAALMSASHRSMRDDFEITTPEIDQLADAMSSAIGMSGGVRMTGGGFGGCVIALVQTDGIAIIQEAASTAFRTLSSSPPKVYVAKPSNRSREIEIG